MTLTAKAPTTGRAPRTDDELLAAVRAQEPHAYQELRDRHRSTALGVAVLHTPNGQDAEQLAGTAFDQVLADQGGADGSEAFLRARLVSVIGRAGSGSPSAAEPVSGAYLALPSTWQAVLWYRDVEGLELSQAAALLGLSPATTSALHLEARAGLRAAYRRAQIQSPVTPACDEHAGRLGAFVGGALAAEQARSVQEHLDECPRCTAEHLYLQDTDAGLRTWVLPVLAGVSPWGAEAAKVGDLVRIAGHVSAGPVPPPSSREMAGRLLAAADLPRRGRQVLLGAGALATVVVIAAVSVTGPDGLGDTTVSAGDLSAEGASAQEAPSPSQDAEQSSRADRGSGPVAVAAGAAESTDTRGVLSLPTAEPSAGPLTESAAAQRRADGRGSSNLAAGRTSTGARGSVVDFADEETGRPGAPARERSGILAGGDRDAAGRDGGSGAAGRTAPTSGGDGVRSSSSSSSGAERPAQRPSSQESGAVVAAERPVPSPAASVPGVQLAAPATPAPATLAPAALAPASPAPVAVEPAPSPVPSLPGVQLTDPVPAAPAPEAESPAPAPVMSVPSVETAVPEPVAPTPLAPAAVPLAPATVAETPFLPHPTKSVHPGKSDLAPRGGEGADWTTEG